MQILSLLPPGSAKFFHRTFWAFDARLHVEPHTVGTTWDEYRRRSRVFPQSG